MNKLIDASNLSWENFCGRKIPSWWKNAKFGIFLHWGPYAVPAFRKISDYVRNKVKKGGVCNGSEWYLRRLTSFRSVGGGRPTLSFHKDLEEKNWTFYRLL